MARIVADGHGELYHRPVQCAIVDEWFPRADEAPQAESHDADNLFGWMIDIPPSNPSEPAIGGARLYPPTQAGALCAVRYCRPERLTVYD